MHLIDELAEIRATMKTLRRRANAIRKAILDGTEQPYSELWQASTRRQLILRPATTPPTENRSAAFVGPSQKG